MQDVVMLIVVVPWSFLPLANQIKLFIKNFNILLRQSFKLFETIYTNDGNDYYADFCVNYAEKSFIKSARVFLKKQVNL